MIPTSSYLLLPTLELRPNDGFKGLSIEDAANLSKYKHFRPTKKTTAFCNIQSIKIKKINLQKPNLTF